VEKKEGPDLTGGDYRGKDRRARVGKAKEEGD